MFETGFWATDPSRGGRKRPSFRNWERHQIESFRGRSWPLGAVSGDTRLANIFLKFRYWELCPWVFSLVPRWPCQACTSPRYYPVGHPSLWAACGQCLSNTGREEVFHLGFGRFCSYCKWDCFPSSGHTQFFAWSSHRVRPITQRVTKSHLESVPLFISSLFPCSIPQPHLWPTNDLPFEPSV